jgi:hypothetical protein
LYAELGVTEYFLFDPEACYLDPPLQGFRLEDGVSVPIAAAADGSLTSEELELRFVAEGGMLRVIDVRSGELVPTREERAAQEKELAEQEKSRAEQEKSRAEQEKSRAEQEKSRAEQEKSRADALEAEVARLRALLKQHETLEP